MEKLENVCTLLDSGSTDCFIDSRFAIDNNLPLQNLEKPLQLSLFNGSTASQGLILQSMILDIQFPCGTQHQVCFLLTPLDQSASAVLGYSWLTLYNLLIDWVMQEVKFRTLVKRYLSEGAVNFSPVYTPSELSSQTLQPVAADLLSDSHTPTSGPSAALHAAAAKISISVISAHAVSLLSCLPRCHPFSIVCSGLIRSSAPTAQAAGTAPTSSSPDLALEAKLEELRPKIPEEYRDYVDVFSKSKGTTLPPRRLYDHKIKIEDGTTPPMDPFIPYRKLNSWPYKSSSTITLPIASYAHHSLLWEPLSSSSARKMAPCG